MEIGNNIGKPVFQHGGTVEIGNGLYTPFPVSNVPQGCLAVEVSFFKSVADRSPVTVPLMALLSSELHKATVLNFRTIKDKEAREMAKKRLPGFTPSGLFSSRCGAALIRHSGLICLDIDSKGNEHLSNFGTLVAELRHVQNVAYCGKSVSGNGWFLLVPIASPERHREHFEALELLFWHHWKIRLDRACKDVCRFRFVSYDPDAFFNPNAIPHAIPAKAVGGTYRPRTTNFSNHANATETRQLVEHLIKAICNQRADITPTYRNWFEIGCSLAAEFGETGREYFQAVSQFHPKYNVRKTDQQFDYCLKNNYRYTIATFLKFAKLAVQSNNDFNTD